MNKHYEMFVLNYNAINHPKDGQTQEDILAIADKIIAKGVPSQIQGTVTQSLPANIATCINSFRSATSYKTRASSILRRGGESLD